jgi:hypothetical protein
MARKRPPTHNPTTTETRKPIHTYRGHTMTEEVIALEDYLIPVGDIHEKAADEGFTCANCETGYSVKSTLVVYKEGYAEPITFCSVSCLLNHFLSEVEFKDE